VGKGGGSVWERGEELGRSWEEGGRGTTGDGGGGWIGVCGV